MRRAKNDGPDLGALFLGAKGENAEILERLLLDAFRDHVFWRRNFHPEDGFAVSESDKRAPAFEESLGNLRQELMGLLSELKGGVPFYSPRYIGHMTSDASMASLIGYFAALLYNPNNVSGEASPVTTRLELEASAELAAMIGYPAATQWSHLTSGGTVANFEALWAARSVKYLPVALRWASDEAGIPLEVRLPDGERAAVKKLSLWELLNVTPTDALDALDAFHQHVGGVRDAEGLLARHSLSSLGHQEFGRRLQAVFDDALSPAVVLVPSTAHYSWEKICRALGIGSAQLVHVPVDDRFRTDVEALEVLLRGYAHQKQPVLACVGVIGTTEESAVDRLDQIARLREEIAREHRMAFTLHADAAWGGYAAASTRHPDGTRRHWDEVAADAWPSREVFDALCALERTDSITIDPHKLGFAPYPAGAICFRDRRVRTLSTSDAPYVFHPGVAEVESVGRYILEGSRPGAAGASVWMSHRALPLDRTGFGKLIRETVLSARKLHFALANADLGEFRAVMLPEGDINLVCFTVTPKQNRGLHAANAITDALHRRFSTKGAHFFVSRTSLRPKEYGEAALHHVKALGADPAEYRREGGVSVLRCTVMKPFPDPARGRPHLVDEFVTELKRELTTLQPVN